MDRPLKIALLGYGKMNRLIERIALDSGHSVDVKFSRDNLLPPNSFSLQKLAHVDVCIDFSHPDCILRHLQLCINYQLPLVIGTTGWEDIHEQVMGLVHSSSIGCLYSPNFSIGLGLFKAIVNYAAKKMVSFDEYDLCGIEHHHKQKIDSPSGTARALIRTIKQAMPDRDSIAFSSVRCGYAPGSHTILIDGPVDSITLTHTARNREGFAMGAIAAAKWIIGKKGFFTMDDFLQHMCPDFTDTLAHKDK